MSGRGRTGPSRARRSDGLKDRLRTRAIDLAELMDDPDCDPVRLDRTYRRFELINALVSGWRETFRTRIAPVLVGRRVPARILDLGCGGGDLARALARRASATGIPVEVVGIDPDERAIRAAKRRTTDGVSFRVASSGDLVAAGEVFDVVVSNHVLHHLHADDRDAFFADSAALATSLVVHSDIRRSPGAYRSYAAAAPFIAPGTFVLVDGLRSIRRSYTAAELRDAAPAGWSIAEQAPHRVLAVREAPGRSIKASAAP
ncbi:methyltransferase domain-containing protein [Curtobacterium ammoniigenes]|uniref:methyltransferase domain-containing protein n=1 Tax=Curtobacterium ammoniigenes TaxID=395387 RepID=UPI0009FB19F2|nr:methyltransferase domain-containing protein [Curtobacterium ammoniigenes]